MKKGILIFAIFTLSSFVVMFCFAYSGNDSDKDLKDKMHVDNQNADSLDVKRVIERYVDNTKMDDLSYRLEALEEQLSNQDEEKKDEDDEDLSHEEMTARRAEEIQQAKVLERVTHETYEQKFFSDTVDPEWDGKMRENMDGVLNESLLSNVNDYEFDCRSTMCKMTAGHEDEENQKSFLDMIVPNIFAKSSSDIDGIWEIETKGENGEISTEIYFFKKGEMSAIEESVALNMEG